MRLLEGLENSVFILFFIIMCFVLYIFYKILEFIMIKSTQNSSNNYNEYNLNRHAEGNSDPYAHSDLHEECPICTDRIKYKVELDCRHNFCGKCIMDYYDTVRPNGLKCPLCRENIRIVNAENLVRDNNTREFYDRIVKFNHRNLSGVNYVSKKEKKMTY